MSCYESGKTNIFIEEHPAPFATPPLARFRLNNSSRVVPAIQLRITILSLSYLYETLLSFDESGTRDRGRDKELYKEEEDKGEREREIKVEREEENSWR